MFNLIVKIMKTKACLILFFLLFISLLINTNSLAQEISENCRVLLHTISGVYQGGCKNGFAHGKGISQGIDKYEGRFKKGLPNGSGKYFWANGNIYDGEWKMGRRNGVGKFFSSSNGESVLGYWKDDEFINELEDPGFRINNQYNIQSISIDRNIEVDDKIVIVFMRDGKILTEVDNLDISVNNGFLTKSNGYAYRNIIFPWTCNINFTAYTKLTYAPFQCKVNFEIMKKGSWQITIKY